MTARVSFAFALTIAVAAAASAAPPNVVFILADDVGYGDFGCYGATKVKTPIIDKFAAAGLRFTDAHSPAAVCTPTRYALMTGQYAFRQKGTGILPGIAAMCIPPERRATCLPFVFRSAGYATGVVGKWHLGLGETTPTDYNRPIAPGPKEVGFDESFIIPATGDRVPCVYVENGRVVGFDPKDPIALDYTVQRGEPKSFVKGVPRIGGMTGGTAALWDDANMADDLAKRAVGFIEKHKAEPFFLYFATHDIHVPRVPHPRFRGTSQAGVRGDTVHSFDATVGVVLDALDRLKLTDNTLVIVTSDNGGVADANGPDVVNGGDATTNNGHLFNGPLRGVKGAPYEGGHRVPFIARWPGHVPAGATSRELICHVDMMATFAALLGKPLAADAGPDTFDVLPALLAVKPAKPCRDHLVNQGNTLALREGQWKLIPERAAPAGKAKAKAKASAGPELYDLDADIGETTNLADKHPDRTRAMTERLKQLQADGRSRPVAR
ncbi:MAG: arylsulfatase [Gemmataceae bacterium]